jgi:hypothetical protein
MKPNIVTCSGPLKGSRSRSMLTDTFAWRVRDQAKLLTMTGKSPAYLCYFTRQPEAAILTAANCRGGHRLTPKRAIV